jgi:hypothetical protein
MQAHTAERGTHSICTTGARSPGVVIQDITFSDFDGTPIEVEATVDTSIDKDSQYMPVQLRRVSFVNNDQSVNVVESSAVAFFNCLLQHNMSGPSKNRGTAVLVDRESSRLFMADTDFIGESV